MTSFIEGIRPHSPEKGPPVPSILPKWPWVRNPGSNPAVTLDAEIEEMTRRKREEFRAKGYPPGLIEKALLWAREWSYGLPGVKAAFDVSPEVGRQVYKGIYRQALALSERWASALSQS